jgi:plasmid stability protein
MASITIKNIPEDLHGQLKREAEANFRSLNQEVLARVARTFEIDAALNSKRDQRWIDEAMASGPATPLTEKEMAAVRDRVLRKKAA